MLTSTQLFGIFYTVNNSRTNLANWLNTRRIIPGDRELE